MVKTALGTLSKATFSEAASGPQAIETLAITSVHLVLLDLNVPDMHGLDVSLPPQPFNGPPGHATSDRLGTHRATGDRRDWQSPPRRLSARSGCRFVATGASS
jgi:hypothetical protein